MVGRMIRGFARAALTLGVVAATASPAAANGRYPAAKSIAVRPGNPDDMVVGLTFGAVITHDGGAHWYWTCEESIGYGGPYDPRWSISADDGTIYAGTHNGMRVSRDGGCTFETSPIRGGLGPNKVDDLWVDAVDVASDGTLWIGTTETGLPNAVFRSTDKARSFQKMGLESKTIWWKSIKVAPSNPQVIYATGYQVAPSPQVFIEKSIDGGTSWTEMPTDGIVLSGAPNVLIVAIDPADPDVLFLRSVGGNGVDGDRLYRTTNGASTWTDVLDTDRAILAVALRGGGSVIAGGTTKVENGHGCLWRSTDDGATFGPCEVGPQTECLHQNADGSIFACGANWEPDFFAMARSDDAQTWNKVFRFHEMVGPLRCPAGTVQRNVCELGLWPGIREQFGVTGPNDAGPVVGDDDAQGGSPGCCDSSGGGVATVALIVLAGVLLFWRGRRRKRKCCS
jgi:hypothetical protein